MAGRDEEGREGRDGEGRDREEGEGKYGEGGEGWGREDRPAHFLAASAAYAQCGTLC